MEKPTTIAGQIIALRDCGYTPAQIHFHIHVRIARNAGKEILDIAEEVGADLVVVGNAGHGKIERFVLGSVSDRVVRDAKCAVVIARPKEYAFVAHTEVTEVDHKLHQRMEHHYTYQDHRATMRPSDWPIY